MFASKARSGPIPLPFSGLQRGLGTGWLGFGELRGSGDVSDRAVSAVPDRSEIGPYLG